MQKELDLTFRLEAERLPIPVQVVNMSWKEFRQNRKEGYRMLFGWLKSVGISPDPFIREMRVVDEQDASLQEAFKEIYG